MLQKLLVEDAHPLAREPGSIKSCGTCMTLRRAPEKPEFSPSHSEAAEFSTRYGAFLAPRHATFLTHTHRLKVRETSKTIARESIVSVVSSSTEAQL